MDSFYLESIQIIQNMFRANFRAIEVVVLYVGGVWMLLGLRNSIIPGIFYEAAYEFMPNFHFEKEHIFECLNLSSHNYNFIVI